MSDFFSLLLSTVLLRPYVFLFLLGYLIIAFSQIGIKRTLIFTVLAYLIAFISEYSSTRNGFPYGYYTYMETTRGKELWIANVPFFDSLSYSFLAYLGYSMAIFFSLPPKTNLATPSGFPISIRYTFKVLTLGTIFFVLVDVIVDPLALQGSKWFLGHLYEYREKGLHFGVPLSNYAGWFIVGFNIIGIFQRLDRKLTGEKDSHPGWPLLPYNLLFGPILYFIVIIFNLFLTFYIRDYWLGICSSFIFTVIFICFIIQLKKINNGLSQGRKKC